ncbi:MULTISPECIES: ROK family transcriptional regulator [Bifidobacterium]|uniref:ROK family transcriptional regulator n=1 Tax=Bifidobacterium TaxID=1678 RepID=UPI001BDBCFC9|nr:MULTISPECIES: ROK family transcriptional regulator [Bifidobacterium]MBT1160532.1 ROK family transcriptional regulator [Bifidobacterium sp. SO1]MBW3078598.1 ROK family transcriptional regulator [Bifidobacterium simiiventris]
MPSATIRTQNQTAIIHHLYQHHQATKLELMQSLNLSSPTVTQNLRDLTAGGIVSPGALQQSTGGRKARAFIFNPNHRLAIGVAPTPTAVTLRAINLYGATVADLSRTLPYRNDAAYWQRVGIIVNEFAANVTKSTNHNADGPADNDRTILGIGLCLRTPAATPLAQTAHYPCATIHYADASATAEAWFDPTLDDAICVYLDRQPSGSLIIGGRLHQPTSRAADAMNDNGTAIAHRNGTIEHMTLVPGGRECTCGRRGCMSAYCSPQTLPEDYESIPGFFSVLEQGETHHRERMNEWLDYVAQAIANARTIVAGDVIVGGEAAQYLDDNDIAELTRRVIARSGERHMTRTTDAATTTMSSPTATANRAQPTTVLTPMAAAFDLDPMPEPFTLRISRADDRLHVTGAALGFVQRYMHRLAGI